MKTNTLPIENVLSKISQQLCDSPPDSPADPRLADFFNFKLMSLQLGVAEKLHELEAKEPENAAATARLYRALTLLERTTSRAARLRPRPPVASEPTVQREDALRFLKGELSAGPKSANDLFAAARKLGIAPRTLIRAKTDLGIISIQIQPDGQSRCWVWSYSPLAQSA